MTVQRPGLVKAGTAGANGQGARAVSNSAALRAKKAEDDFLARHKRQPTGAKCQADPTAEARCRSRSAGVSAPTPARNVPARGECGKLPATPSQQPTAVASSAAASQHGKTTVKTAKAASSRGTATRPKKPAGPKPDASSSMASPSRQDASRPEDKLSSADESASCRPVEGPPNTATEHRYDCQFEAGGLEEPSNEQQQPDRAEEEARSIAKETDACQPDQKQPVSVEQNACQPEQNPPSLIKEQEAGQPEMSEMPANVQDAAQAEEQLASLAEEQDFSRRQASSVSPTKVQGCLEELPSPANLHMAEDQEDTVTLFPSTALPLGHASSSTLDGGTFQPKLAKVVEEAKACLSAEQQDRPGGLLKEVLRRGADHMLDSPELDSCKQSSPTSPQPVPSSAGRLDHEAGGAVAGPLFQQEDFSSNCKGDFLPLPEQLLGAAKTKACRVGSKPHQCNPPTAKGGGNELQQALARQANKCVVLGAQGDSREDDGPEAVPIMEHIESFAAKRECELQASPAPEAKTCTDLSTQGGEQDHEDGSPESAPIIEHIESVATEGRCELQQATTRQAEKCIDPGTECGGGQENKDDRPESAPIIEHIESAATKGGCELQQALARQAKKCIDLGTQSGDQKNKDGRPVAAPMVEHVETTTAKGGCELRQALARQAKKCIDLGMQGRGEADKDDSPEPAPIVEHAESFATKGGCELQKVLARQAKKCIDLGGRTEEDEPQATLILEHAASVAKGEGGELQRALARQANKCIVLGTQGRGQEDDRDESEAARTNDRMESVALNSSQPLAVDTGYGHQRAAAAERDACCGQAQHAGKEPQQRLNPRRLETSGSEHELMHPEQVQHSDNGHGQPAQVRGDDGSEMELDLRTDCGECTAKVETEPLLAGSSLQPHMVIFAAGLVPDLSMGSLSDGSHACGPIGPSEKQHSSEAFSNQGLEQTRSPDKEPEQHEQMPAADESEMDLDVQTDLVYDIANSLPQPLENREEHFSDGHGKDIVIQHEPETMSDANGSLKTEQRQNPCKEAQMHGQEADCDVLEHLAASTRNVNTSQNLVDLPKQSWREPAVVHGSLRGCQLDASDAMQEEQKETTEQDKKHAQNSCQQLVSEPQQTRQQIASPHSSSHDDSAAEEQNQAEPKLMKEDIAHVDSIPSGLASPVRSETSGSESQMMQNSQEETLELASLQARLCGARLGAARPSMLGVISEEYHMDGAAAAMATAPSALPSGSLRRKAGSSTARSSSEEDSSAELLGFRAGAGTSDTHQVSSDFEDVSTIEAEETTFRIPEAFHRHNEERLTHEQISKDSSEENNSGIAIPAAVARQEQLSSHAEDSKHQVQQSKHVWRKQESFGGDHEQGMEEGGHVRSSVIHGRQIDLDRSALQHSMSADARKTASDSFILQNQTPTVLKEEQIMQECRCDDAAEESSQELFKQTAKTCGTPGDRTSDASKVSAQRQPRQRQPRQRQKPPAVGGDDSSLPSEAEDQPKTELLLELAKQLEAVTSAKGSASWQKREPLPVPRAECSEGTWMSLADASRAGIPIERAAVVCSGTHNSATQDISAKELRRKGCGARLPKSKWCYLGLALAGVGLLSLAVVEMAWQLGPEPEWFA